MSTKAAKSFRVVLERMGDGPYWIAARLPLDLKKAWPEWRNRRVCGAINDFAFQTSLLPTKEQRYILIVNKKMQIGAKAGPGDKVQLWIEPDLSERAYVEPKELTRVLRADRQLRKSFDAMSSSMRKGFASLVDQAKGVQTRKQRAERLAEALMQAIEGEQVAPPILRAAFLRQPLAERGWNAMTPKQRRSHLLAIFFPGTIAAQTKRAASTIEQCLRVAHREQPEE
jgi:uncharacterized protein YdeI (YjbR/CyaY-like superfamily)